jgi:hypothetical protein
MRNLRSTSQLHFSLCKLCMCSAYSTYSACSAYVPYDSLISDFKNRGEEHEHDCSDVQCEVRLP